MACSSSSSGQVSGLGSWCGREILQHRGIQTVVPVFCAGFGNYFWQTVYTEFFPTGLTEYHSANVADGQTLARRVKASAVTHAALLGADFKTTVDGLVDGYLAARETQMERKGAKTEGRGSRDVTKAALQEQLFDNLLFLAGTTKDPEKCVLFFDQSLLEDPAAENEPEPVPVTP